jgi:hypothetical protein
MVLTLDVMMPHIVNTHLSDISFPIGLLVGNDTIVLASALYTNPAIGVLVLVFVCAIVE